MVNNIALLLKFRNSKVFSNFLSLSVLQAISYILPLATVPYLVRVLGIETFGLLSFVNALIIYFQTLTDYGFNLSATRAIAINRENDHKLNEIFSSVFFLKLLLTIVGLLILTLSILLSPVLRDNWLLCLVAFSSVFGQALLPIWFFLGVEQMRFITYFNLLSKIFFTLAIFLYVNEQSDYLLVPLFTSLGSVLAAIVALWVVFKKFGLRFEPQKITTLLVYLKDGWNVFIANIATNLYTVTTTVLLGFFTNDTLVGYYSIADKLIAAIKGINNPISQALYPYISRRVVVSRKETVSLLRKLIVILGCAMLIVSLIIIIFARPIMLVIFGGNALNSVLVFQVLAIVPFLVTIDTFFGTLTMLIFDRSKEFTKIIVSAGLLNVLLSVLLIQSYQHIGAALSVLLVEIYISTRLIVYVQTNDLKIFKPQ
jgi:polysaccharide transporter, PST family